MGTFGEPTRLISWQAFNFVQQRLLRSLLDQCTTFGALVEFLSSGRCTVAMQKRKAMNPARNSKQALLGKSENTRKAKYMNVQIIEAYGFR